METIRTLIKGNRLFLLRVRCWIRWDIPIYIAHLRVPRAARRKVFAKLVKMDPTNAKHFRCWEVQPGAFGFSTSVEHKGRHYYGEC